MRLTDLLILPVAALWQQKVRTLLTTLGVVFGAFVLAASLSIGSGVQETIDRESHRSDISRRVEVFPKWKPTTPKAEEEIKVDGEMSDSRKQRLRKLLAELNQRADLAPVRNELTRERLQEVAALPHVKSLVPVAYNSGFAILADKSEYAQMLSARADDEGIGRRLVAGHNFHSPASREVIISEFLAYRLGMINESDVEGLIGKPIRLEFRNSIVRSGFAIYIQRQQGMPSREERAALDKITSKLPESLEKLGLSKSEAEALRTAIQDKPAPEPTTYSEEFTVAGVIRKLNEQDQKGPWDPLRMDSDILIPYETALDIYFKTSNRNDYGVNEAVLLVDSEDNVKAVVDKIRESGLESRAAIEFIERERLIYLLIFGGMTCVAGVALLVSALGIANTMLMSVLERTREIGIMKAVGADNRHLIVIFLIEGALIGLLGAVVGLLLAWGASYPGDAWVRSMVLRDIKIDLKGSIFVFPVWMSVTVMFFTVLVTTLAAVYPARHAARIDTVSALRHE